MSDLLTQDFYFILSLLFLLVDVHRHLFLLETLVQFQTLMQILNNSIFLSDFVMQISNFLWFVDFKFDLESFYFFFESVILSHFVVQFFFNDLYLNNFLPSLTVSSFSCFPLTATLVISWFRLSLSCLSSSLNWSLLFFCLDIVFNLHLMTHTTIWSSPGTCKWSFSIPQYRYWLDAHLPMIPPVRLTPQKCLGLLSTSAIKFYKWEREEKE